MALRQALVNYKFSPEKWAEIEKRYSRFGGPAAARDAYLRRQERARRFGIQNLNDANSQQIRRAAEAGLIGQQQAPGVTGGPQDYLSQSMEHPTVKSFAPHEGQPVAPQPPGPPQGPPPQVAMSGTPVPQTPTPAPQTMAGAAMPRMTMAYRTPLAAAVKAARRKKSY